MKKVEKLMSKKTKINRKNKKNRKRVKVSSSILDKIEKGISIEELEKIGKNLPIFKYKTQITIHGLFPQLKKSRVYGYKNIFQNKNKSIGIRYNAIDEQKRRELFDSLRKYGFEYKRTSKSTKFFKFSILDGKKDEHIIENYKELYSSIDTNMFIGDVDLSLYKDRIFGVKCIYLTLSVNAIYKENIPKFIDALTEYGELINMDDIEYKKREEKIKRKKRIKKEAEEELKNKMKNYVKQKNKEY